MPNESNLQLALVLVHHRSPISRVLVLKLSQSIENRLVRRLVRYLGKGDSVTLSCVPLAESVLRLCRCISN
jgi:hypothetical protein